MCSQSSLVADTAGPPQLRCVILVVPDFSKQVEVCQAVNAWIRCPKGTQGRES